MNTGLEISILHNLEMSKLLDTINSPSDLKKLSLDELRELAVQIREELVNRVTLNGGHLASSLGVVELTIALHRVFESPKDKIIWDVGHQSYAHKLLTGRREQFATLRQHGGLSGFTCRDESPHDPFGAGHASTSISAGLGMAVARDLAKEDYSVISVIGDGAISGGMSFEAINNAGHLHTKFIVILNDNGMAISPSTGALSKFLNNIRFDPRFEFAKRNAKQTITNMPFGKAVWAFTKSIKRKFEKSMLPGSLWEELGFIYLGPVDGHNIRELEAALKRAKDFESKPVLIHMITKKGKGYDDAEADAVKYHGISPKSGGLKSSHGLSYSQVFGQTLHKIMSQNPQVVAITAAMTDGCGLGEIAAAFPDRVFDVGICEQHAVTFAAGMATQGYIPVVVIYSTFLQRGFDQIIHDVCLQKLPVVFAIDRGGIVGDDGKTHQGIFDLSFMSLIPDMVVSAPSDENDLQHLIYTAVNSGKPFALRYPRGFGEGVEIESSLHNIPIGQNEILVNGSDVAILATGKSVAFAKDALEILTESGIKPTLVNNHYISPLDSELVLKIAQSHKYLVTVEENVISGGLGSRINTLLAEAGLVNKIKIANIGIPDKFVEHGNQSLLRAKYGLDGKGIAQRVLSLVGNPNEMKHPQIICP